MNRRIRPPHRQSPTRSEPFLRYLKPGALARLRDSRISARSQRANSLSQIYIHRTSPLSSPSPSGQLPDYATDGSPCFAWRIYGPRCPQRKKLVAAKSVLFLSSSPASPGTDSLDPIMDVFSSDILVAH